jgi:mRNA-degrading endonuclease RelE of RelBE toxin-antitoxin system
MTYKLFEHNRVKKFLKKHEQNKKLLLRINKEYKNILKNPYNSAYKELNSVKCPKCHRARVGNYRIIFYISEEKRFIEIIDIIPRKDDYKLF